MNELEIQPETRPEPKVALLTFGQYFKMNHDLSIARGWQLGQDTERTFEMNPKAAKVNIQYDIEGNETGYDIAFVMPISAEIQENHADLLAGIELIDSYIPADTEESVPVDGVIDTNVIDWTLNHYQAQGVDNSKLVTYIASQAAINYPPIPSEGEWCEAKIYSYNGDKAKCLQPHTRTHRTPEEEPALWLIIETVTEGYPEWVQPTGAHDAWQTGDIVHYPTENDGLWISKIDANTTVPDGDEPYNRYWEPYTV